MKTLSAKAKISGLTLIEVLAVLAVLFILAAMLLPRLAGSHKSTVPLCMSNQKQIAIAFIMFNDDHAGKYRWQISATNGGSMESVSNNQAFRTSERDHNILERKTDNHLSVPN